MFAAPANVDEPERRANKSLVSLCRDVIVSNLERYPAEAFGILEESEWDSIIRLRHKKNRPRQGRGGLDGKGRMNPAVSDKFMLEVETVLPYLSQCEFVDKYIWKDIVEFRFRIGGVSRPKGLLYPWPVLTATTQEHGDFLVALAKSDEISEDAHRKGFRTIRDVCDLPMDVELLKSTGIGKAVKKFLKACASNPALEVFDQAIPGQDLRETPRTKLESVLKEWMAIAANSGVEIKGSTGKEFAGNIKCAKHLTQARNCNSWRELYTLLNEYDEKRMSRQGARMRERRQRLDSVRPKIVKVRHATSRQNDIIGRRAAHTAAPPTKQKMQQLRMEASVTSSRRTPPAARSTVKSAPAKKPPGGGFGAAVAFATGKGGAKRKRAGVQSNFFQLEGNKRMKVPATKKAASNLKRLAKKGGFSLR